MNCATQDEVDHYWEKLAADGGQHMECGWLKDKYGLAWQIVPQTFFALIENSEPARLGRVMRTMMTMQKMDIAQLQAAADAAE